MQLYTGEDLRDRHSGRRDCGVLPAVTMATLDAIAGNLAGCVQGLDPIQYRRLFRAVPVASWHSLKLLVRASADHDVNPKNLLFR